MKHATAMVSLATSVPPHVFHQKQVLDAARQIFGKYPELLELVSDMTDEQLARLHRGGHDPLKIYNAYKRATEHRGGPTVILAKTVKGYGLGSTEARNASHQEKKLTDDSVAGIGGAGGDERGHRSGLGDPFFQNLAVLLFAVVEQHVYIVGLVFLPFSRVNTNLPNRRFETECTTFIGNDRHDQLADLRILQQMAQDAHKAHRG